jgi:hypothetical protein
MPVSPPPALRRSQREHFDANGLLRRERYRRFAEVLEAHAQRRRPGGHL